jgi:hypothetical protein
MNDDARNHEREGYKVNYNKIFVDKRSLLAVR